MNCKILNGFFSPCLREHFEFIVLLNIYILLYPEKRSAQGRVLRRQGNTVLNLFSVIAVPSHNQAEIAVFLA